MAAIVVRGDFHNLEHFLRRMKTQDLYKSLDKYGELGVSALASATPVDTGNTAASWNYEIETTKHGIRISWTNSNVNDGVPIAVLLQYGHATRSGTFVEGRDYINPAILPIFDDIAESIWKEVTR